MSFVRRSARRRARVSCLDFRMRAPLLVRKSERERRLSPFSILILFNNFYSQRLARFLRSTSYWKRNQTGKRMKRCDQKVDIGRRWFLSGAGVAVAGAAAATAMPQKAEAAAPLARVAYPSNRLANVGDLKPNTPLEVSYPDANAPGVLLKLGAKVPGGVGPQGDIVGFTTICPHKGFPLVLQYFRQVDELPRPLLAFRLRERRPRDLGTRDAKSTPIRAPRRRQRRYLRRRSSMNCYTAGCQTCWGVEK